RLRESRCGRRRMRVCLCHAPGRQNSSLRTRRTALTVCPRLHWRYEGAAETVLKIKKRPRHVTGPLCRLMRKNLKCFCLAAQTAKSEQTEPQQYQRAGRRHRIRIGEPGRIGE